MASDLQKIAEAFRLLGEVTFPDGFLRNAEVMAINAHFEEYRFACEVCKARVSGVKFGTVEAAK